MINTGYILLDCTGIDLATASATITGIYEKALGAIDTGKVIYLANVVNGTTTYSPMPVYGALVDTTITFNLVGKTITITNADAVTIA